MATHNVGRELENWCATNTSEDLDLSDVTSVTLPATTFVNETSGQIRLAGTNSTIRLTGSGATIDLDGVADALVLDGNGDTTISSPTGDQIDFEVAGSDVARMTGDGLTVLSGYTTKTNTLAETTAANGIAIASDIIRSAGYSDYSHRNRVRVFEDFMADAGATLPTPWGVQDTSSAGSPTLTYVADALNGTFTLTHDTQSEAQNLTLYWADQLMIDPSKNPVMEVRMKINFAGAAFTADQRIVIGLATARNATLDSVAQHAWFRIEGANLNILWETDDGSVDDDDNDSGIDIVDDTYTTFRIDLSNLAAIGFYVDGVAAAGTAAATLTASHKMQPFIEIQRDAGAEAEAVTIDYIMVEQDRT